VEDLVIGGINEGDPQKNPENERQGLVGDDVLEVQFFILSVPE
jgi:hypothetical protein